MITKRLKLSILFVFSLILLIGLGSVIVYALCPHGVAICGTYYDCSNVNDTICPEDYMDGATCCDAGCPDYDTDCGQKCCIDEQCTDVCTWCDASFQCNEIPVDDPGCNVIDCDGLNYYFQSGTESPNATETCNYRDYDDLSNNRCEGLGDCKDNNTADCTSYADSQPYPCGYCRYISASDCTGATLGSCTNYPLGTSCPDDGDACTRNECNSTGYCEYTNYCSGTDTSCGCSSCTNCNTGGTGAGRTGDGCLNDAYIDYYCSGNSCTYTSDDCSDCSCTCGNYGFGSEAGFCNDGFDNDCDGSEWDYDTLDRGPIGNIPPHGDNDCAISTTANPIVSNSNPCPGEIINVTCTSNVGSINSIDAYIDSTKCSYIAGSWVGNTVKFRCTSSSTPTTQTIMCAVDNSKSYQSGANRTTTITVGGVGCCSDYTNSTSCEGDGACDWCPQCTGPKWSNGTDRCVAAGTCNPYCWQGQCGAVCDATNGGCSNYCSGDTLYFNVVCNDTTCACTLGSTQNCNDDDCSYNLACSGIGTSTIRQISDNYTCSGASCTPSGTMTCDGPWTCNAITNCTPQLCNGTSYECYYDNGWKWGLSAPGTETNCTDGFDNDCDGLVDKDDNNCDEICNNDMDDDDDGAIDGCDSDCQEGQGIDAVTVNRCCDEGGNNDWDGIPDEDDPGCCDFCLSNPNYGFDVFLGQPCGVGCDCGGLIFKWENDSMEEYCCGDDTGEFFINTTIGSNNYYACCDNGSDCVDSDGNCQIGKEELFELCSNGKDDDCDNLTDRGDTTCQGMVSGYVYDEDNSPISGAIVKGSPPGIGPEYESNATTGPFGGYTINEALVGEYSFVAKKDGYDDKVMIINVTAGIPVQVNFSVRNGSCHEDCTDYYGNCNPTCDGVEFNDTNTNCTFISPLCQSRPEGFIVRNIISGTVYEYTCCEGPMRSYPALNATVRGDVESLYDYVFNVKLKGRYVRMHILVWKPKD